ncbi:MAG: VCBS repeat-containing protein [Myxococcales bacterium]|nr:VCBS repeat-containing protein [Myxococcales bacterium]
MRKLTLAFFLVTLNHCSGEGSPPVALDDGGVDAADGTVDALVDTNLVLDTSGPCLKGQPCGDAGGGLCVADGVCCDRARACGAACCPSGNVCSFGKCVTPGAACVDATECKVGEICDYALGTGSGGGDAGVDAAPDGGGGGCTGGKALATGRCLPRPPVCDPPGSGGGDEPTCLDKCEYRPKTAAFTPTLKYAWGKPDAVDNADSVMMSPIVVQLDDDNCDGVVDEKDIPEIVFSTFSKGSYQYGGTLHAISVVGGKVVDKWVVAPAASDALYPGGQLAAGNIDGKPGNEIVSCARDVTTGAFKVRALDAKGKQLWVSPALVTCHSPSIADLAGDGAPEVIVEGNVLDGVTGKIVATLAGATASSGDVTVADITGDGKPEIVSALKIWDGAGVLLADATDAAIVGGPLTGGSYVAIADFDKDGKPEVVSVDSTRHLMAVWRYDPTVAGKVRILRRGLDINSTLSPSLCPTGSAGNTRGGGPPTVADFNGDGVPDFAIAGGVGYAVFDGKKILDAKVADPILWIKQTHDCSSASTGSSVFDFDGDGKAEVIYSDEWYLRIYRGSDGAELFKTCNTTGTLQEYPVIADVDNDGHADIVVASNSYSSITCPDGGTKQAGIRIFGDKVGNWVRTRRIWNQHTYHVTNVNEDGSIPKVELANWTQPRLNNFRQNVQPLGEFAAPDLVVSLRPACDGLYGLIARVRNLGEAAVEAPVSVGFYAGATKLGIGVTTKTLYPAEAQDIVLLLPSSPAGVADGTTKVHAVVDDGALPHAWHECRVDNNKSALVSGRCAGPK